MAFVERLARCGGFDRGRMETDLTALHHEMGEGLSVARDSIPERAERRGTGPKFISEGTLRVAVFSLGDTPKPPDTLCGK